MALTNILQRTCEGTTIGDLILKYSIEGFIIIFGLIIVIIILGLIWLIRQLWMDIFKY